MSRHCPEPAEVGVPHRPWPRQLVTVLVGIGALGLVLGGTAAADTGTVRLAGDNLTCSGKFTMDYTPAITAVPQKIDYRGSGMADNCISPNGSQAKLQSARISFSGSGSLACDARMRFKGSARFTWYGQTDAQGKELGTSDILFDGEAKGDTEDQEITDREVGKVSATSSIFPGGKVISSFDPIMASGNCTAGVRRTLMSFNVDF